MDFDLLRRCQDKDKSAFEELVLKYQDKVYSTAFHLLGNEADAFDASQEAFLKAYQSIKNFRGDSSFSTWIYRIVTNVCLDELRRRGRRRFISIDGGDEDIPREIADEAAGPEEIALKNADRAELLRALSTLGAKHRAVLVLRDIKGLTYEEISGVLKCSVGTVKSRLFRARAALAKRFSGEGELFRGKSV